MSPVISFISGDILTIGFLTVAIFGFIFGSFLVVWQKNDQNGPKNEVKNDVKNGYHECSETQTSSLIPIHCGVGPSVWISVAMCRSVKI